MIIIRADRANAKTVSTQLLTSGMVGAQVKFVFSNEWEDLRKTAVFQVDDKTIDVLDSQWDGNICTIPNECLATSGKTITVGVYGCNDVGDLVIPTVYTKVGRVRLGADPSNDATADSTLPVYEQIRGTIGKLSDLDTVDKSNLVAAINEVAKIEPATTEKLGGIKVGDNLSITEDGTLSADAAKDAVSYAPQELTEDQQIQARKNLGLYYKKTLFDISWDGDTTGKESVLEAYFNVAPCPEMIDTKLGVLITLSEGSASFTMNFEISDASSEFGADAGTVYGTGSFVSLLVQKEFVVQNCSVSSSLNGTTLFPGVYLYKEGSGYISRLRQLDEQKILLDNVGSLCAGTGENAEVFNGGESSMASGDYSHAEGAIAIASGDYSHAEGEETTASGNYSHAEGWNTTASGNSSHAEGADTIASGIRSHAEGQHTKATGDYSHVQGKYNIEDTANKYVHIVGNGRSNGTENGEQSNAHTLDWSGNGWFAGDVYVGSTSGTNKDDGSKKLATEDYVNSQKFSGSYNDLIDKPEIPDTTPFIIDYENPKTDDYTNAIAAFNSGKIVLLKKGNEQFPMSGYDDTHCYFGGSDSAYLPGGYVNAVYAHIGANGENYYWYPYKHAIEAAGLYSEDAGNYYTSTNVMGQLQEVGEKLANTTQSIPKIESLDTSNIKTFRSIEDGIYILDGYFAPYTGSDSTFIFDPPALVSISSTDSETHVQIFEAYNNQVQHLVITDTSCEETYVPLNDIAKSAANSLPTVTASDNGKFLQVVDGAWTAATISNANGVNF